ncbi:MAG: hypothetical protein HW388_1252 [Dehalococcoidia bacterium]|nr:hypothetical protein [Dehalococcoidia bacterium]
MRHRTLKLHLVLAILLAVGAVALASACGAPAATPTPPPTATSVPTPTATPVPAIGMAFDQRYHDIHVNRLDLQCTFCHTQATPAYYDPLAQVFNLADRRACLSCHKEETIQPFYGEEWQTASVK